MDGGAENGFDFGSDACANGIPGIAFPNGLVTVFAKTAAFFGICKKFQQRGGQFTNLILGAALTEALGILAFVLGLLILFS